MKRDAPEVFRRFFTEADRQGVPYVILHSYEHYPESIDSDVDFAVAASSLPRVEPLAWYIAEQTGWLVAQRFHHEVCALYLVLADPNNPREFLKLDACSDYVRLGCRFLSDEVLLQDRRKQNGFYVPAPSVEFVYLLAKGIAKGKDLADVASRLRQLWGQDPAGVQARFSGLLGAEAGAVEPWLAAPRVSAAGEREFYRRHRYSFSWRVREHHRRWKRVLAPTGMRVAVLGPDGVGKSTAIQVLQNLTTPFFRAHRLVHFGPGLFRSGKRTSVEQPHAQKPRSAPARSLKLVYYFVDQWLGYWLQQVPAMIYGRCVIFDRSFEDLSVDPHRYRLRPSDWLARLNRWLPAFHRVFILSAPPAVIHQRKPELPMAELERQLAQLHHRAAHSPQHVLVHVERSPEQAAREIGREILWFLSQRWRRRPPVFGADAVWTNWGDWPELFSSPSDPGATESVDHWILHRRGRPFLALPTENRAARAALRLYAAQSVRARALWQSVDRVLQVGMLVPFARRTTRLDRTSPLAQLFAEMAGAGGNTLPRFGVLLGNPHLPGRRFVFLVLDDTAKPVGVVKAGATGPAADLVRREGQLLATMASQTPGLPRVRRVLDNAQLAALALDYHAGGSPATRAEPRLASWLNAWIDNQHTSALADSELWRRFESHCSHHPLYRRVNDRLRSRHVARVLFHGDFVPWNIRVNAATGAWVALDWERGEQAGPPAWDWFHYVIQSAILAERQPLFKLVEAIEQLLASQSFGAYARSAGITGVERELALAYLLYCAEVIRPTESLETTQALARILASRWPED